MDDILLLGIRIGDANIHNVIFKDIDISGRKLSRADAALE
jgi:hypothetical protein